MPAGRREVKNAKKSAARTCRGLRLRLVFQTIPHWDDKKVRKERNPDWGKYRTEKGNLYLRSVARKITFPVLKEGRKVRDAGEPRVEIFCPIP